MRCFFPISDYFWRKKIIHMKKYLLVAIIVIPFLKTNGQGIGEIAPEKEALEFPQNAWGVDIMFGEGGFGLGTFYRRELSENFTLFTDFSISEAKDEKEIEYYDYYGRPYVIGKKNRIFIIPLVLGAQYRIFKGVLSDNLRPYINAGLGPTMVATTPYEREFFKSIGYAQAQYTLGGYIGFGANFGMDQSRLMGINLRYYVVHFFNDGVEGLKGRRIKNLGGFYLTINIGSMY